MPQDIVLHEADAVSFDRVGNDNHRFMGARSRDALPGRIVFFRARRPAEGFFKLSVVIPVYFNYTLDRVFSTLREIFQLQCVFTEIQRLHVVVVHHCHKVVQAEMIGEQRRLPHGPFVAFPVSENYVYFLLSAVFFQGVGHPRRGGKSVDRESRWKNQLREGDGTHVRTAGCRSDSGSSVLPPGRSRSPPAPRRSTRLRAPCSGSSDPALPISGSAGRILIHRHITRRECLPRRGSLPHGFRRTDGSSRSRAAVSSMPVLHFSSYQAPSFSLIRRTRPPAFQVLPGESFQSAPSALARICSGVLGSAEHCDPGM